MGKAQTNKWTARRVYREVLWPAALPEAEGKVRRFRCQDVVGYILERTGLPRQTAARLVNRVLSNRRWVELLSSADPASCNLRLRLVLREVCEDGDQMSDSRDGRQPPTLLRLYRWLVKKRKDQIMKTGSYRGRIWVRDPIAKMSGKFPRVPKEALIHALRALIECGCVVVIKGELSGQSEELWIVCLKPPENVVPASDIKPSSAPEVVVVDDIDSVYLQMTTGQGDSAMTSGPEASEVVGSGSLNPEATVSVRRILRVTKAEAEALLLVREDGRNEVIRRAFGQSFRQLLKEFGILSSTGSTRATRWCFVETAAQQTQFAPYVIKRSGRMVTQPSRTATTHYSRLRDAWLDDLQRIVDDRKPVSPQVVPVVSGSSVAPLESSATVVPSVVGASGSQVAIGHAVPVPCDLKIRLRERIVTLGVERERHAADLTEANTALVSMTESFDAIAGRVQAARTLLDQFRAVQRSLGEALASPDQQGPMDASSTLYESRLVELETMRDQVAARKTAAESAVSVARDLLLRCSQDVEGLKALLNEAEALEARISEALETLE